MIIYANRIISVGFFYQKLYAGAIGNLNDFSILCIVRGLLAGLVNPANAE